MAEATSTAKAKAQAQAQAGSGTGERVGTGGPVSTDAPASTGDPAASPAKVDLKRALDAYRATRGTFRVVEVPELQYLMIDGHGDPNTSAEYASALEALYPLAYALKFFSKRELGRDYVVMPLEGLWWADDLTVFTSARDKSQWDWTMMILQPDWLDADAFATVRARLDAKGASERLDEVRWGTLREGRCVQTLHVGSYDDETPVLAEMHDRFIPEQGLRMAGTHHEIYLSDARKVAPEKLRTILRQPVEAAK